MERQGSLQSTGSGAWAADGAATASAQGNQRREPEPGQEDGNASMELLAQQGSVQEALFSVLYKLSKERLFEGWRVVLSVMIIDYLQLAVFFIGFNFPWRLDFEAWHIKILKTILTFYFQLFYISTLGIFGVALDCTYSGPAIVPELLAVGMAYFVSIASPELDPSSKVLSSQANTRSALWRYGLISVLTIVNQVFPSYTKIQAIACIIITTYLWYMYVRYMPFRTAWINGLQASFFASLSWASFLIVLMAFFYQSSDEMIFTILLWVGLLVVVPLVWVSLYLRVRHAHKVALMFRLSLKDGSVPVIHKFIDELEVEVVARCGRIRDQWGDVIPAWIDTAEAVYKAGLVQFPESAFLRISYSSFLVYQRKSMQAGAGFLESARRLETSLGERYMIFVSEHEQKQHSGSSGDGSPTDLLSLVEFENTFRAVLEVHRQALRANRNFWRQLVRKDVAFRDLTGAFTAMEGAEKRADSTFAMASGRPRLVLDRYHSSPKLLHAYALYLESVKHNPSHAARYRAEAQRLEAAATGKSGLPVNAGSEGIDGEGAERSLGGVVNSSNDAVVVIKAGGVIQLVNHKALELFGYKEGELDGKSAQVLIPPPFFNPHNLYLQRYKKIGEVPRVGQPAFPTVVLHSQGFNLPVTLAIKQLQQGEDKGYIGIFKPAIFQDFCGYSLGDLRGDVVGNIIQDGDMKQRFKAISEQLRNWQFNAAEFDTTIQSFEVSITHKYGAAVLVSCKVTYAGTEAFPCLLLKFDREEAMKKVGLLSVTPAGQIVYANASFEAMLGYESGFLLSKKKTLRDLMSPPTCQLHLRWRQQASHNTDLQPMAPTSCRTGRVVALLGKNNKQVPVRLHVSEAQVGKVCCLAATVTKVEVPEADAWGGGDVKAVLDSGKRMQLLVHADGRVLAANADRAVALHGFGQDVTRLGGSLISELVQDINEPAGLQHDWPSVPQLLFMLSHETCKIQAAGGAASFRVGVVPSTGAATQTNQGPMLAGRALPAGTIPCRMVVLPLVDDSAVTARDVCDGEPLYLVELRLDAMLEAVLEIDSQLRIRAAAGNTSRADDFLAVKRTRLKHGGDLAVGEKLTMEALHADGSRMLVQLQGADKHGDGSRWIVRVTVPPAQPAPWDRPDLVEALRRCVDVTASPQSSRSSSPEPENTPRIAAVSTAGAAAKVQSADRRSEHSMDEGASNNDGASAADPQEAQHRGSYNHYQRVKRLQKLKKLLTSRKAQRTIHTLKWASIVMSLMLLGLHALFFSLTIKGTQRYQTFFQEIVQAGQTCVLSAKAEKLDAGVRELVFGTSPNKLEMPPTQEQRVLLVGDSSGVVLSEVSPNRRFNASLFDLAERFTTAGRLVGATAASPTASGLVNMPEVALMTANKDALSNGLLASLNYQKDVSAVKLTQQIKELIIFTVTEVGGLIPLCCGCLYVLLSLVQRTRLKLFSVFLAVPRPVVMQLATQEVQVSLDEDEEGDDDDGEAWLRQQQQEQEKGEGQADGGIGVTPDEAVGFSMTSRKRKLKTNGLAANMLLLPSLVSNLVAANILQYLVSSSFSKAVGIAFGSSLTSMNNLKATLAATYSQIQLYENGLLYGDATLGLEGALRHNNRHEKLWFGSNCLLQTTSNCRQPGDPLYVATNSGLNQLVNLFILNAAELTMLPTASITPFTDQFLFIWNVTREGEELDDALNTNTADFVADGQGRMTAVVILQVVAMVLGVVVVAYFQFYMLGPFLMRSKKESRRVAELLSQLPPDLDVEHLVLSSTNQQEEDSEVVSSRHHRRTSDCRPARPRLGWVLDSAAGSQGSERRQDQEDGDASTELLTQQGGLQEALFGVLHKLCKEPLVEGWRFALSAMVINYLQLAVFFIGHNFPWTLDFEAW
ncbi:hypothetical protein N2152v2_000170 [Parachlorella kessleri]